MTIQKILLIASVILFILAAVPYNFGFNVLAVGLAAFAASHLS